MELQSHYTLIAIFSFLHKNDRLCCRFVCSRYCNIIDTCPAAWAITHLILPLPAHFTVQHLFRNLSLSHILYRLQEKEWGELRVKHRINGIELKTLSFDIDDSGARYITLILNIPILIPINIVSALTPGSHIAIKDKHGLWHYGIELFPAKSNASVADITSSALKNTDVADLTSSTFPKYDPSF